MLRFLHSEWRCASYVVLYLLHLAYALWRYGEGKPGTSGPVTFRRVFVTTLLNPKAIIFAFTLLPPAAAADTAAFVPWLAALALQIFIVGGAWIAAGSLAWDAAFVVSSLPSWATALAPRRFCCSQV